MKIISFSAFCSLLVITPITTVCMQQVNTCVQNPRLIAALSSDKIFIGGSNGFELVNPVTNTSLHTESFPCSSDKKIYDVAVNTSKTLYGIAISGKVICYNATTNGAEWEYHTGLMDNNGLTFNPNDDSQVITRIENHSKNPYVQTIAPHLKVIPKPNPNANFLLCCHPSKDEILVPVELGYVRYCNNSSSYGWNFLPPNGQVLESFYDPIGISAVINIILPNKTHSTILVQALEFFFQPSQLIELTDYCAAMSFYRKTILAVLLRNNTLQYWKYRKNKLLQTITLDGNSTTNSMEYGRRIAFSSDHCLVALSDKCYRCLLPLEVTHKKNTKSKLFPLFLLLYNTDIVFKDQSQETAYTLPVEVVATIFEKLLLFYRKK